MTRSFFALAAVSVISAFPRTSQAQTAGTMPTPAQAQAAMADPSIRARLQARIKASGMTPDQIRTRLKGMGYSDDVINQLVGGVGVDTTAALGEDVFAAARSLGIDIASPDSARASLPVGLRELPGGQPVDSAFMDSLSVALQNDTLRAQFRALMGSPLARSRAADSGFTLFGRDLFNRQTTQFDAALGGPLPPSYRIGFGDQFTLVFTGDIERTENLVVTRDGWVVLRDVGQIPAANLTFDQFRSTLDARLGRVYSGIRTGLTHFAVVPTKVGSNQVFVLGSVSSPNAYQISRLGTVLSALYAAGGPSIDGDSRMIELKRSNVVVATMDLYEYLLTGSSTSDVRLENGDIIFVRPQGPRVRLVGTVVRPAIYEVKTGETLADLIRMAGGFRPEADRRRVQIERIIPPARRTAPGNDREFLEFPAETPDGGSAPASPRLEPSDIVRVFPVSRRVGNRVKVTGNVWLPTWVGLAADMRLSDAIARAGGLKPDTYQGVVQISRLEQDSTRQILRVGLDKNYRPIDDILLAPDDEIKAFALTEFRTDRYVSIGGSVKGARQFPYREGMTLRDLILLGGGLEESALLTEVEIASLPLGDRANRVTAVTRRVPIDSSYLLETPTGRGNVLTPPRLSSGEVVLQPYDAVTVLKRPGFSYARTVWITGEVKYAGQYALKSKDDRLYDMIQRAGGLTPDAYAAGVWFSRARGAAIGRIGVDLPRVLRDANHRDNLLLTNGDSIHIPPYSPVVTVRGEVNSANILISYVEGKSINYYIAAAGGRSMVGDDHRAYVTQPNGMVESKRRSVYIFPTNPTPQAGSTVTVPVANPADKRDWISIAQSTLSLMTSMVTVAVLIKSR